MDDRIDNLESRVDANTVHISKVEQLATETEQAVDSANHRITTLEGKIHVELDELKDYCADAVCNDNQVALNDIEEQFKQRLEEVISRVETLKQNEECEFDAEDIQGD